MNYIPCSLYALMESRLKPLDGRNAAHSESEQRAENLIQNTRPVWTERCKGAM